MAAADSHRDLDQAHERLREALDVTRHALGSGQDRAAPDAVVLCQGLCRAVVEHQRGQDQSLFPVLAAHRPELGPVLHALRQDHALVAGLVEDLRQACESRASVGELDGRVEGLAASLDTHFRREQSRLHPALDLLDRLPVTTALPVGTQIDLVRPAADAPTESPRVAPDALGWLVR